MHHDVLFLEIINFYMESVCQEVIEKLPKIKYVNDIKIISTLALQNI